MSTSRRKSKSLGGESEHCTVKKNTAEQGGGSRRAAILQVVIPDWYGSDWDFVKEEKSGKARGQRGRPTVDLRGLRNVALRVLLKGTDSRTWKK